MTKTLVCDYPRLELMVMILTTFKLPLLVS
jgi:hypothetical protein